MIKYFRFDYDYVLWGISFLNLNMLLATIPQYKESADKEVKKKRNGEPEDLEDIADFLKIK